MIRFNKLDPKFVKNNIPRIKEIFSSYQYIIDAVYLFGSFHTNKVTPLSDIDIAVLYNMKSDEKIIGTIEAEIYDAISRILKTEEIDIINMNCAPLSIQYGVVKNKEYLYIGNKDNTIDFENKVILDYLDFKPYREEMNEVFLKTISEVKMNG